MLRVDRLKGVSVERRRPSEGRQPRGQWCRWMVASALLHALLLGGLVFVLGTDTKPAATLRARLVTVVKAVSPFPSERQTPAAPVPPPVMPALSGRATKVPTPPSSSENHAVAESSSVRPAPPPETVREISSPPVPSALSSDSTKGDGASSAPAGRIGEGVARPVLPRSGPHSSQAETISPATGVDSAPPPAQLEAAARGVFLMPDGSGSGTGRAGVGAADQGASTGGGGTSIAGDGGNGSGKTGKGASGQAGGGGTGLASRGGSGGPGSGDGVADILRSIRRQIEQNKIYPDAARREGIQGTVELRFRIAADGSVEAVEILRSSGFGILDEASQQTIRRAGPYPLIRGWIRLPLSYRLDQ